MRKRKTKKTWLWEFSKKACGYMFLIVYHKLFFYACAAMWYFQDFAYLGTYIEQASDILRTCVFGYFAKAGIENVFKIKNGSQDNDCVF